MHLLLDLLTVLQGLAFNDALDAKARAKSAAAVSDRQIGVVEDGRTGMPECRGSPARPRQTVVIAADFRVVLRRPHRHQVEFALVFHVRFEALRRLTAIAGRPAAAIDFAQDILCRHRAVFDLDVFKQQISKTQLACEHMHDVVVVLRFEHRLDDLLAPLKRTIGSRARSVHFETGAGGEQISPIFAAR